jgi:hypothetical protein
MAEPVLPPSTWCRGTGCGARIIFLQTTSGKRIPLDAAPHPNGNIVVETDLLGDPIAHILPRHQADRAFKSGAVLRMPHHASCPAVEEFRR